MKTKLSFAAIDKTLNDNMMYPTEKYIHGVDFVSWGDTNKYPSFLFSLYRNVPTLKTIIDGCVDYICGENIMLNDVMLESKQEYFEELVRDIAFSYVLYGGYALNVIRNRLGQIADVKCLDFRKVRTNKDNTVFYYSTDFDEKSYGRCKCIEYPAFALENKQDFNSIVYVKNSKYTVYPIPMYDAAVRACMMEQGIDEFQLNAIENGFVGSVLVSLNNGVPDDEQKEDIEKNFNEKFCGKENAGRVVISYNDDKEHAATIEKVETEDFSERYKTLAERSQQAIFIAFRATPMLFGLADNSKGFARTEYQDMYSLFYTTVIRPIQTKIVNKLNFLLNANIKIEPFTIKFETGTVTDTNISTEE